MKTLYLCKVFLKDLSRQKTIIFSSFILPIVIIWSTWWVTADVPMQFELSDGTLITANMINVHVFTGALTAMSITAGLFGFIIAAKNQEISARLHQSGYSISTINIAAFFALLSVLILTSVLAFVLSINLSQPQDYSSYAVAIIMGTIIYAGLGNLIGSTYPNITAGSLFILIFAFMDTMLFTNPMGEGLYLQDWTYFLPGFWPVQLSLAAGFDGVPEEIGIKILYTVGYFAVLLILAPLIKSLNNLVE